MRVACVGEAMIELTMGGATPDVGVAGDTLNTAVYLKRMAPDIEVDYVTRLGVDPFSQRIRDFIVAQNLGADNIEYDPAGTPGLYAITTDDAGERTFTYWRAQSAARGLFQDGFHMLDTANVVYLTGISLAILPDAIRWALLEYLSNRNVTVAFDSNHRPKLWEGPDTARKVISAYWKRADILLPSIDDEMEIYDETAAQVTARFLAMGKPGALKRSALGPLSLGKKVDQPYPRAAHVVDTTAAGDSFSGGYLAAKLQGAPQAAALMTGHELAAHVVGHRGAIVALE